MPDPSPSLRVTIGSCQGYRSAFALCSPGRALGSPVANAQYTLNVRPTTTGPERGRAQVLRSILYAFAVTFVINDLPSPSLPYVIANARECHGIATRAAREQGDVLERGQSRREREGPDHCMCLDIRELREEAKQGSEGNSVAYGEGARIAYASDRYE